MLKVDSTTEIETKIGTYLSFRFFLRRLLCVILALLCHFHFNLALISFWSLIFKLSECHSGSFPCIAQIRQDINERLKAKQ